MLRRAFFLLLLLGSRSIAADAPRSTAGELQLYPRDQVHIGVQGEPDVTVERQIDPGGAVNLPLLGTVKIGGLTIAQAQRAIADSYIKEEIFIHPEVVVTVVSYAPKEVMLLGQVAKQGKVSFPAEASILSIVEAIAAAGGLTRIAKGDAVRVTRHDEQGEVVFTLNVDKMVDGRGATTEKFMLQPGDVVFVPERVF